MGFLYVCQVCILMIMPQTVGVPEPSLVSLWLAYAYNKACDGSCGAAQVMLLCDGCDAPTHLACTEPRLRRVPKGAWFCGPCTAAAPSSECTHHSKPCLRSL